MSRANASETVHAFWARTVVAGGLALALALVLAAPASAGFEQVGTFGEIGFSSPLHNAEGVAVNSTGAGGVPAGTVYAVGRSISGVMMYNAKGEFLKQWGGVETVGVAVDQTTGDVYLHAWVNGEGNDAILVYSADGSQLIARFGVIANSSDTVEESPEKVHGGGLGIFEGIAVDGAGEVYLPDSTRNGERRVMVFEPKSPGDYEHYVYAGRAKDIAYSTSGDSVGYRAEQLVADTAGDLYFSGNEGAGIYEFAHGEPNTPTCQYKVPAGGAEGVTVDSQTGDVYYYTYKDRSHIHQLACNAAHEFVETDSFALTPQVGGSSKGVLEAGMYGLAFDPALEYEGVHPAGVIYGLSEVGLGYILAPAESRPPVVESASTVSVASTDAALGGEVDPNGFATRYVFQYIGDAAYQANEPGDRFAGAAEAPLGGGALGGGTSAVSVGAVLRGLAPDVVYHYRLLADSHCNPAEEAEVCEVQGSAQTFRTYPSEAGGLPDGRVYELVSPLVKDGGEAFPLFPTRGSCQNCKPGINSGLFPVQSSPDGDAILYMGSPFSLTEGASQANQYLSRRTASGWQTSTLSPLLQSTLAGKYVGFDATLTEGVLLQGREATLSAQAPEGYPNLYGEPTSGTAQFTPLVTGTPPNRNLGEMRLTFAGGSADYSKLFFQANDALTEATASAPAAIDGGAMEANLYESSGGALSLVNVLPGNEATAPGAGFGAGGSGEGTATLDFSHAISDDGSRVFWSDAAGQVYVREDGERTLEVPDHAGRFLTASANGAKVLLSDGHLYDLETEQTSDLTEGRGGFQGIAGQSEDLSHIYFVDTEALTPSSEENGNGEHAQTGRDNLYAWFEGTPTFVGVLLASDGTFEFIYGTWKATPADRSAQASPDGRWLAFLSSARLTGDDNTGACTFDSQTQKIVNGPCTEAYLYDSATGKLSCASCNRSGVTSLGPSHLPLLEGAPAAFGQPRYLTDQGRLYFDSTDSLSPFDANNGVEDVYQYEQGSVGGCARAAGCVNLISSGHGPDDSNFLATDATGKNVFFTTRDRLVAADHDELVDVYDAREGGGIAAQSETVKQTECQGETCQSPPMTVPNDPRPASPSFEGAGNLVSLISPPAVVKAKPKSVTLTRAQKLAKALQACKRQHGKRHTSCERLARRRYGRIAKKANSNQQGGGR
jgi:hypothetical protein